MSLLLSIVIFVSLNFIELTSCCKTSNPFRVSSYFCCQYLRDSPSSCSCWEELASKLSISYCFLSSAFLNRIVVCCQSNSSDSSFLAWFSISHRQSYSRSAMSLSSSILSIKFSCKVSLVFASSCNLPNSSFKCKFSVLNDSFDLAKSASIRLAAASSISSRERRPSSLLSCLTSKILASSHDRNDASLSHFILSHKLLSSSSNLSSICKNTAMKKMSGDALMT
mmetsp:Transcript_7977/g.18195  ORF Transcript_7977/g.18195 Transcript_7977/m.18195 type:complete len:224 (-) Transcript_7977:184-855(-)